MARRLVGRVLSRLPEPIAGVVRGRHYLRVLRMQRPDQEKDFAVIARLVRPGDHVVDIGANYGAYTKFLAELVGVTGAVYSIEPVPATFKVTARNVRRLNLRNVRLLNYAFSDRCGEAIMEIPRHAEGGENYYMAKLVSQPRGSTLRHVTVQTVTMDSQPVFMENPITFIKCDVEGHELPCVSGARETIRKWKPAWYVEVSSDPDRSDTSASRLFKTFEEESYRAYWFDGQRLRKRMPADSSVNYFFLHPRHLADASDLM